MKIDSYIKSGNSFPIIVTHKGKKYLVKLRAGMSGKHALVNEWLGNKLGNLLKIKTQTPRWIELNNQLETNHIYIEVRELIRKSLGLNIGFDFLENVDELTKQALNKFDYKEYTDIFLLDLLMLNIDRTSSNLNLLTVNNEIIAIDYESSLLLQDFLGNQNILNNQRVLECLKSNPLYHEPDELVIDKFIERLNQVSIHKLISQIPESLLTKDECKIIINKFEESKRLGWRIKQTLRKLKNIKLESQEEKTERINNNQANFVRRLKEDSTFNKPISNGHDKD